MSLLDATPCDEVLPLTPEQRAILFESLNEGPSIYAVQLRCSVSRFELGAFQEAWDRLVARHGALRTAVRWEGRAQPVQILRGSPPTAVRAVEVRGADRERLGDLAARLMDEQFARETDLQAPRLVTPHVVYAGDSAYASWNAHHLVLDGLSSRLMIQQFAEEYDRVLAGVPAPPGPADPLAGYLRWRSAQKPLAPVRQAEEHDPILLRVLGAERRPGARKRLVVPFPEGLTGLMRAFAKRAGTTMAVQYHAAWALALAALGGTRTVRLGTTSYGRPAEIPGSMSMLGMFTVTRPTTAVLDEERNLADWLGAYQQELVRVWEGSVPAGSLGDAPVIVVSHYRPLDTFHGPHSGATVEITDIVDRSAHPLVATTFIGDQAMIVVNFNGIVPARGAVQRLVGEVIGRLKRLVTVPDPRAATLHDLLSTPVSAIEG
jgi:hypothetical protein